MDNQIPMEAATYIKQVIVEKDATINVWDVRKSNIKLEQDPFDSIDPFDIIKEHHKNSFDSESESKTSSLDFKQEEYDTYDAKSEMNDVEFKEQYGDDYIKQDNLYEAKEEIDIDNTQCERINFACSICNFKTEHHQTYLEHVDGCNKSRSIVESMDDVYKQIFRTRFKFVKELQKYVVTTKQKEQICMICHKTYGNNYILKLHTQRFHSDNNKKRCECENERQYECEICRKTFRLQRYYRTHMRLVHEGKHECEECHDVFENKSSLKLHTKTMHSKVITEHECAICHKVFDLRRKLREHMIVHRTDECQCEACDKIFNNRRYLLIHLRNMHGMDKKSREEYSRINGSAP